jgi:hypothetical protein
LVPTYIPEKITPKSAVNLCKKLNGKMLVISQQSYMDMALSKLREENQTDWDGIDSSKIVLAVYRGLRVYYKSS